MGNALQIWNGRGHGDYNKGHFYVAAYTKKQACELISIAAGRSDWPITLYELNTYYSNAWGNTMDGITPTEPCVYATKDYHDKTPIKVV